MRALDLFCGAGGATMGLMRAGFEVVGIDNNPKRAKRYPATFVCADALNPPVDLADFDFVWASPPCQRYLEGWRGKNECMRERYQDSIPATRALLDAGRVPYVIENVPGAPVRKDVVLTGALFDLDVVRRRLFECGGFVPPLALCREDVRKVNRGELACVVGHGANRVRSLADKYGGWRDLPDSLRKKIRERNNVDGWRAAMGIDWMTCDELAQAIPPAYAEFIATAFLKQRYEHGRTSRDA